LLKIDFCGDQRIEVTIYMVWAKVKKYDAAIGV
jgi:hypothetical protein